MGSAKLFGAPAASGRPDDRDIYEEVYMGQDSGEGQVLGIETGYPSIHSRVYKTDKGIPYLRGSGVVLVGRTESNLEGVRPFLNGFDPELEFDQYLNDTPLEGGTGLIKFAGQLCYASFGPKRTYNAEAAKYMTHIKESKHGSVLHHADYSFFVYGISRSLSHELVRHAAGTGFSQLSQRFVSGKVLRFVERAEYHTDPELHDDFCQSIEEAAARYERRAQRLYERQVAGEQALTADRKTDLRKKVQQAARSCLPNETETFMMISANVRAWRHMCEMRAAEGAETEIRELYVNIFKILKQVEPVLFDDYTMVTLSDGTKALSTQYQKV